MSRSLVYRTQARDAVTQLPIVVIDATALTPDAPLPDTHTEIPELLRELPTSTSFVLVFFASRAPKAPQVGWLRRTHAALSRELKKRIRKVYVVHESWYMRTLSRALSSIVSPKFSHKIVHVRDLAELARNVDITAMDINPAVYIDDLDRSHPQVGDLELHGTVASVGAIPIPKQYVPIFGLPITHMPTAYWRAALLYLGSAPIDADTFIPSSRLSPADIALTNILLQAVRREQHLRLHDYGPRVVLAVLKEYMLALPQPLLALESLPLPMNDSVEYVDSMLSQIRAPELLHLEMLVTWMKLTSKLVGLSLVTDSLSPAIFGKRNPSSQTFAVITRFMRAVVANWPTEVIADRLCSAPVQISENIGARPPLPVRKQLAKKPKTYELSPEFVIEDDESYYGEQSSDENTIVSVMPRDMPSEIIATATPRGPRLPSRKAFGRVAEIVRLYDENQYS